MITKEHAAYENNPKSKGSCMVLSMPGAGGNLLLELMAVAGRTHVTGSQEPSFYYAITTLMESVTTGAIAPEAKVSNGNTYGEVYDVAQLSNGFMHYAGHNQEVDERMTAYYLKNLLLKGSSSLGMALTDRLREMNDVERFCSAIRSIEDLLSRPFKVVFLVCDLSEGNYLNPIEHNKQLTSYKNAMELGDIWIKKSELLSDPMKIMMKLGCAHYPDEHKVKSIIKKYEKD